MGMRYQVELANHSGSGQPLTLWLFLSHERS